jgi:TM2 domain-containing membrane protein YozV
LSCGCAPKNGNSFCQNCGVQTQPQSQICTQCQSKLIFCAKEDARSRLVAGLLGIFLGGFGVHRFYLGYVGIGIIQLILTLLTCGVASLWGFVEGILLFIGTIDKDVDGQPLRQ